MSLDDLLGRLATAAGWEERSAIYREIPCLAEPDEALEVLDCLRRRTRDGNDLYFLRAAVSCLGCAAQELRQNFFDHIPRPPESLFLELRTPQGPIDAWREIPPGRFLIGSPDGEGQEDERPRHEVGFEKGFRIGSGPVTNAQYRAFDPNHPVKAWEGVPEEELADHPAGGITWYEANAFCEWLSQAFEFTRGARLPGEEEWEYACRAGTDTLYWSGNEEDHLGQAGWYRDNSDKRTHRIGEKPANAWGLFDVHGNVREWTASPYRNDYAQRAAGELLPAREGDGSGLGRVLRGGGFWDEAPYVRSAIRCVRYPEVRFLNIGFRVLLNGLSRPPAVHAPAPSET